MVKKVDYLAEIENWEYCYCRDCDRIRYGYELEATERGIRCSRCGGYNLEAPGWVSCPQMRGGAVKCPRAGRGIVREEYAVECQYHCSFQKPEG